MPITFDLVRSQGVKTSLGWRGHPDQHAFQSLLAVKLQPTLDAAIPFDISNVAEYMSAHPEQKWYLQNDFPNVAPPFPAFWMEYRLPRSWRGRPGNEAIERVGALFKALQVDDERSNTTWAVQVIPFLQAHHAARTIEVEMEYHVDSAGSLLAYHLDAYEAVWNVDTMDKENSQIVSLVSPMWLALCFLHCKNVTSIEQEPPHKVARAFERRHGAPPVRYHTLVIEPMQQVLRREGHSETLGLKRALHICRGHFADYSEGNGLFGKYKGRFWVPAHVRGNATHGVTHKDYQVNAPA